MRLRVNRCAQTEVWALSRMDTYFTFSEHRMTGNQGWQVVAKSGLNHWFLPVKTGWQKMWVAKSGKK